uniref:inorganic diphosphatase n=1 Tax=Cacopsylla melanoneura TaxID=428564 RepID=A0A8D8QAK4_9HEMI
MVVRPISTASIYQILFIASSLIYTLKAQYSDSDESMQTNEEQEFEVGPDPDKLKIKVVENGIPETDDYRLYFKSQHGFVSPLNDIPLFVNLKERIYNMVVEIPKGTNVKLAMSLGEKLNPIKHEVQNGKLGYVHLAHVVPHHGYIWNYGAFPSTWENPNENEAHTGYKGDGGPVDVVEIGDRVAKSGDVIHVKALGALGLIVDGKMDYKIIAIDVNDPKAAKMNEIHDVETYCPGLMKDTVKWFEHYNVPKGKSKNTLAFNGEFKDREFANNVTVKSFYKWLLLSIDKVKNPGVSLTNTVSGDDRYQGKISFKDAAEIVKKQLAGNKLFTKVK